MNLKTIAFGIIVVMLLSVTVDTAFAVSDSGGRDWTYNKEITIRENSGKSLTDFQVLVELNSANFDFSKAESDGSDIRFSADGEELNYWIEEWGAGAKIWVKVPSIPSNGEAKIKMYYGNPSADAVSDGDKVFEFFDDFEGESLDTNKWSSTGDVSVSNSEVVIQRTNGNIMSRSSFATNIILYTYAKLELGSESNTDVALIGLKNGEDYMANDHVKDEYIVIQHYANDPHSKFRGGSKKRSVYESTLHYLGPEDSNWHTFEIVREGSSKIIYKEDAYSDESTEQVLTVNLPIWCWSRHNGDKVTMDWILVRKYTFPEPTFTLSQEYPTTKPTPAPSTPPTGKIKAVWLYDHDKCDTTTLITALKSTGIDTVFVSTDVDNIWSYERFVKSAHENEIEVHAMILAKMDYKDNAGDHPDYTNFYNDPDHKDKALSDVKKVLNYNSKSLAPFDGINIDLEPYTSDLWNSDRTAVWNDYVDVLSVIYESTKGETMLSADIPVWYDDAKIKDLTPHLDLLVIMAYDSGDAGWNTASEIEDVVASEMGAIRGEGSKAVIGVGVHEGFEDKGAVEKCVDELYKYYSGDSAFLGVSIFKYGSYSGLSGASEAPTEEIPEIPTGKEKGIPGFEAIFAIAGLLMVAYVLRSWGRL